MSAAPGIGTATPGVQCDIESYIYLPLLEELGYLPRERYSYGPEIWGHIQAIARHFDLYRDALFQTSVTGMRWDDELGRWHVATNRGDELRARHVVMAIGPLSVPKLPGIPGLDSFQGHTFHTSRWDYGYTGGDTNGGLVNLTGKRVGIIGTGATAVQCVPHLGQWAKELFVFQRTPSSIDERGNRPTDPEWAASLEPGWQQERFDNFGIIVTGGQQEIDLVDDGWTRLFSKITGAAFRDQVKSLEELADLIELSDMEKMEELRARIEQLVDDPATAEALKPWYRQFCKRPCFHDDYIATFNRPNVTLVDTKGRGVERITEQGVVVAGVEYELDCLIFATGFEVGTQYTHRAACDLEGRDGITLSDKWGKQTGDDARADESRLPQLLLHGRDAVGREPELHRALPPPERAHRLPRHPPGSRRGPGPRTDRRGRGRMVGHAGGDQPRPQPVHRRLHAGLLQQRGQARRGTGLVRRQLRPRRACVLRPPARVA